MVSLLTARRRSRTSTTPPGASAASTAATMRSARVSAAAAVSAPTTRGTPTLVAASAPMVCVSQCAARTARAMRTYASRAACWARGLRRRVTRWSLQRAHPLRARRRLRQRAPHRAPPPCQRRAPPRRRPWRRPWRRLQARRQRQHHTPVMMALTVATQQHVASATRMGRQRTSAAAVLAATSCLNTRHRTVHTSAQ